MEGEELDTYILPERHMETYHMGKITTSLIRVGETHISDQEMSPLINKGILIIQTSMAIT